jgi:hypothetical protein
MERPLRGCSAEMFGNLKNWYIVNVHKIQRRQGSLL